MKQVLAQLGLMRHCQEATACNNEAYFLAKLFNEQEARLHLSVLGAMLTVFPQEYADYIVVKVERPFKSGNDKVIALWSL